MVTRWIRVGTLTGVLAAGALMGCSGGNTSSPPSSPNLSAPSPPSSTSSSVDERQAVVTAYTQFWPRSVDAVERPESSWRRALAGIAAEPQLSTMVDAMQRQKAAGIATYGEVAVRISSVEVSGSTANVVDCQDGSHTGQADARTGAKKTVGVARMPVRAALIRDAADGKWKVSRIEFPGGAC